MIGHELQPTIHIGKNGVTSEIMEELRKQLNTKRVVKVKMLKTFTETVENKKERKKIAQQMARESGTVLEGITGFVFVLRKEKSKQPIKVQEND